MEPSEIQGEYARFVKTIKDFSKERDIVILSAIAVIASILAILMSWSAVDSAKDADAKVDRELWETREELTATKNMMVLHNVYLQELYLIMKDAGFDPPPLPEE